MPAAYTNGPAAAVSASRPSEFPKWNEEGEEGQALGRAMDAMARAEAAMLHEGDPAQWLEVTRVGMVLNRGLDGEAAEWFERDGTEPVVPEGSPAFHAIAALREAAKELGSLPVGSRLRAGGMLRLVAATGYLAAFGDPNLPLGPPDGTA